MYNLRINFYINLFIFIIVITFSGKVHAQQLLDVDSLANEKLRVNLNKAGTNFIQFSASTQIWMRYTENNPGSTVFDNPEPNTSDISIRRLRIGMYGKVADKTYVYIGLGDNNINYLSGQGVPIKILDAQIEYHLKDYLHLGAGKTGWTGLSRFAAPTTTSILGLDIPIFALATVNLGDDLLRRFSIYAKGDMGKFNYRLIMSKPYAVQNSKGYSETPLAEVAILANTSPAIQYSGYLKYQFFEKEAMAIPYSPGTYMGKKKVFNLGFGFQRQNDFTWHQGFAGDTVKNDMVLFAADLFAELPMNKGSLTLHGGYFNYNFGPNYLRNIGVNNPVNGVDANLASLNGRGNAFPIIGSGQSYYGNIGYLLPISYKNNSQWQPFFSVQLSDYQALVDNMVMTETGINYHFNSFASSKLTFGIQSRPIFDQETRKEIDRKNMFVLQYQVRF